MNEDYFQMQAREAEEAYRNPPGKLYTTELSARAQRDLETIRARKELNMLNSETLRERVARLHALLSSPAYEDVGWNQEAFGCLQFLANFRGTYEDNVRDFHEKLGFACNVRMETSYMPELAAIAQRMLDDSAKLELRVGDPDSRWVRAHLLMEEVGETLLGLAIGDELKVFDGLCDTLYVAVGAAITMGLPLDEGFAEVHRSNMTKKRKSDDEGRCRDKGDEFSPPDLKSILEKHREPMPTSP